MTVEIGRMESRYRETAEQVVLEIISRSKPSAVAWFAAWLTHQDRLNTDLAIDQLAQELEVLGGEISDEARRHATPLTSGLTLAATVLADAAHGVRVGDLPSHHSCSQTQRARRALIAARDENGGTA